MYAEQKEVFERGEGKLKIQGAWPGRVRARALVTTSAGLAESSLSSNASITTGLFVKNAWTSNETEMSSSESTVYIKNNNNVSKSPQSCSTFLADTSKIISNYKSKNVKFMVENPSGHYLSQVIKVNITKY